LLRNGHEKALVLTLRWISQAALALARRHSSAPQFARSLEWLLFTALEADADMAPKAAVRHAPAVKRRIAGHGVVAACRSHHVLLALVSNVQASE